MVRPVRDNIFYEWDGLAEHWISRWDSFDEDFPSIPYKAIDVAGGVNPVATWILEDIFGLEVASSLPPQNELLNTLPGYDINNRDAYQMVQLSLATHIADTTPKLFECHMNELGRVQYYDIGHESADLDILYEIPTSTTVKPVDIIMITGYDSPPQRLPKGTGGVGSEDPYNLLTFANGKNYANIAGDVVYEDPDADAYAYPIITAWGDILGPEQCAYYKEGYIEYGDPHFDQEQYLVEEAALYNPKNYENDPLYIYKIWIPWFKPGSTQVSFTDTSPRFVELSDMGKLQTRRWMTNLQYVSEYCRTGEAAAEGVGAHLPRSEELKFLGVKDVFIYGFKIKGMVPDFYNDGNDRVSTDWDFRVDVDSTLAEPFRLSRGEDYIVVPDENPPGGYRIIFSCNIHENYIDNFGGDMENPDLQVKIRIATTSIMAKVGDTERLIMHPKGHGRLNYSPDDLTDVRGFLRDGVTEVSADTNYSDDDGETFTIYPIGMGQSGYIVKNLIVVYDWNNPCIKFYDEDNQVTATNLQEVELGFFPIITVDYPPPIAVNAGGSTRLLDQSQAIPDLDASTVEDLNNNDYARAFASLETGDVRINLPFLDEFQVQTAATFLRTLIGDGGPQITKTIVCSPDSEPVLGARVDNDLVINSISYNYQDSSQYTISIEAGPIWLGMSGWETSVYQAKTERLTLEGLVVGVYDNNHKCQVQLNQLGLMDCVNNSREILHKGDRVSVQVFNNPQAL